VREALEQTYRLRSEEVTLEELSLACRLLESDAVYQRETVQGQARKLGFYQSSAGEWNSSSGTSSTSRSSRPRA